jgi:DNA-binding beta-propeller fold protein YncE
VVGSTPAVGHGVFRFPQAVAFSPGGSYVFVADQYSGVVQRFDRAGAWQADIGGPSSNEEVGRLGVIGGLATDQNGHLYVLDSQNDRVQVFDSASGAWRAAWGSTGAGPGRFNLGQNTGAGGIALFQTSSGDAPIVYVADQLNHRIQRFTLSRAATGDPGSPAIPNGTPAPGEPDVVPAPTPDAAWGSYGDCSAHGCSDPGDRYLLNFPQGVAVDPHADAGGLHGVYVADDDNHRVVAFTPDGTYLRQVGTFGTGDAQFRFPYDVGVDSSGSLYVADNNNHRVQKFNAADLSFLGAFGGFGPDPGELEFPRALSALADDPLGGVYVADTANNRVQGFDPAGNPTAAWGIAGRGPGYVSWPGGVAVDSAGAVYIADTFAHRIEKLSSSGDYLGQFGYVSARSGYSAPNTGNGQFDFPRGIALDPRNDNVWVADTFNNRVQVLEPGGTWLATFGGLGAGTAPGQFDHPNAIAADAAGNVYVADTMNDRVQRRDASSGQWSVLGLAGQTVTSPAAVTVGDRGVVYVGDANGLLEVDGSQATRLAPPQAVGPLDHPGGLWAVGTRLYVSDTGHNRVLRFDTDTGEWTVLGGDGLDVGSFVAPAGLATDRGEHALFVADHLNNRVQKLTFTNVPAPPSAPAPPIALPARVRDSLAPRLRLRARSRQRALRSGTVIIEVSCDETCTARASGKLTIGKRSGPRLERVRRTLAAGRVATLRLKITKRARLSIRRALRHRGRTLARVTVSVTDQAGNERIARRTIRLVG